MTEGGGEKIKGNHFILFRFIEQTKQTKNPLQSLSIVQKRILKAFMSTIPAAQQVLPQSLEACYSRKQPVCCWVYLTWPTACSLVPCHISYKLSNGRQTCHEAILRLHLNKNFYTWSRFLLKWKTTWQPHIHVSCLATAYYKDLGWNGGTQQYAWMRMTYKKAQGQKPHIRLYGFPSPSGCVSST